MIFKVDIVWGQALARAKKFHSMCTQTAHTPIFVNFDENGRNFWEKNTPKMCLLGAHTDTPFWGPKPPTIPQNISKFHALTIICRKDTACGKNVTEIGSTFFKCMITGLRPVPTVRELDRRLAFWTFTALPF